MRDPAAWARTASAGAAGVVAAWSVVPVASWWGGAAPEMLADAWRTWGWATAIAAGLTVVIWVLTRGRVADAAARAWAALERMPIRTFVGGAAAAFAGATLLMTLLAFEGNPRNVDGFAQLFHARAFAAGLPWAPAPPAVAWFGTLHMIIEPGRWFSQYPPGQPLVLALGLRAGAWWLLHPLLGALLVVATWRVARWVASPAVARLTVILLCLSPFAVAVAASEMNHLPAATLGLGAAALATWTGGRHGWAAAAGSGFLLGLMLAFRPLDAVAATVPVAVIVWLAAPRVVARGALVAAGGVVGALPTLWYNALTTGSWRTFPYSYLWGDQLALGFRDVPWGTALTPLRAVGLTGLELHRINQFLLDLPIPVLVLAAAGMVAGRARLPARTAVAWTAVAVLMGLLFFYWHRDVLYGPRFLYSVVPWFVLLLAIALDAGARHAAAIAPVGRAVPLFVVLALALGLTTLTPGRLGAYRASTPVLNLHPDRAARAAGITDAVVVIPDGWGTRLIARMWAAGIPMDLTGRLYEAVDACTLEVALTQADALGVRGERLTEVLGALAARGEPGVPQGVTPDPLLRLPAAGPLPAPCLREITADRQGILAFAPFLYLNSARLDGPIVWARDLPGRNHELMRHFPGRALYRWAPAAPGATPVFTRLDPAEGS